MAINQKLGTYLEEINKSKGIVNIDLDSWDPRTVSGMKVAQQQASEDIRRLSEEYLQEVQKSLVLAFITGDRQKTNELAARAEDGGALVVNGDLLYKAIATPVDATIDGGRIFTTNQVIRAIEELVEFARSYKVLEFPVPQFETNSYGSLVATLEDTTEVIRQAIRNTCGDDLNSIVLRKAILDRAIELGYAENIIVVIIKNVSLEEAKGLKELVFPGRPSIIVDCDADKSAETLEANLQKAVIEIIKK